MSPSSEQLKRYAGWIVSVVLAAIAIIGFAMQIEQYATQRPEITPSDYSASDPFTVEFKIRNSMQFTMYDVKVSGRFGPMVLGDTMPSDKDWYDRMGPRAPDACHELTGDKTTYPTPVDDKMVASQNFAPFNPGDEATFNSGATSEGKTRYFYAVNVQYRAFVFGLFTLPLKSDCRLFDSRRDPDGHTHLVPYQESLKSVKP
jgi:hypothetical protein